ncbi:uncharacterized protein K489DRAFT_309602 [Dissoconium aciculare CBS 342.82]|uniref:Uncharacterized protein n=1 Tax=Dissoconium aciculare CBS 342.82 TaxID=1314786 RepID=A0A6J3MID0_9PEZI|nr:uncharacterized protein K489DRAFT_309602 [Dissoconium aciculare CBS 342.82]KAF1827681.1 hypothetical protein K489DRAFT_309602 [Dissoconium aciculare CBS 342.82]
MEVPAIERVSNEIWNSILKEIDSDNNRACTVDERRFLSVESFDSPPAESNDSVDTICKFRRLGRRFAELGAPFLFSRITTRFSHKGLDRLKQLAEWDHLACYVRKFSYLVPYFFEGGRDHESIETRLRGSRLRESTVHILEQKAVAQREICYFQKDFLILKTAIASFTRLQLIQLLRVTDEEDRALLGFLQRFPGHRDYVNLDWTTGCSHAARTIGAALLESGNRSWSRFSSPMLSPASAQLLRLMPPSILTAFAERLTCLTLHFDDSDDLDSDMHDLRECFHLVFSRAQNLQVLHLGFPCHRPLTLGLEDVFQSVTWNKLHAFGVQAWILHAHEIIAFVRRHKNLKGLRLRDVHLRDGSMWKDVLAVLRNELPRLQWVSLRRIGYLPFRLPQGIGSEIPDDFLAGRLDSDEDDHDDHDDDDEDDDSTDPGVGLQSEAMTLPDDGESESPSDNENDDDDDDDDNSRLDFPGLDADGAKSTVQRCNCDGQVHLESAESLNDDGIQPDNATRKKWERWVLKRCLIHGS